MRDVVAPSAAAVALRYLAGLAALNLVWETAQLPLYTLWRTASAADLAAAVAHCTAGDVLIAAVALALAWFALGRGAWPAARYGRVGALAVLLGLAYTVYSEWLNVDLRGAWTYASTMPRVPGLGTGLSPLAQWLVLPWLALALARPRGGGAPPRGN